MSGWSRRFLTVLLVVPTVALQAVTATSAQAAVVAGFEIDGNTPDGAEPGVDWGSVGAHVTDPVGNADTTTFKGSKEFEHPTTWEQGTGLAPNQDDVSDVYTHAQVVGGDTWAYLAFRRLTTSGTTNFDVEFNQLENATAATYAPVRSVDDLMVRFEQDGSSSFLLTQAYRWTLVASPAWQTASCIEVPGYTPRAGWCSTSVASSGFVGTTGEGGHFAEGAFNLSSFFGDTDCRGAFGTMNLRSFTGNSNESSLKDYIEPLDIDIPSNCGQLQIVKVDQFGNRVGGATFTITPNPVPGGTGTLTVTDGGAGDPDGQADGSITINPATPGTYTVVETVAPAGHELPPLAQRTFTVTVGENGVGSSGPVQAVDRRFFTAPTVVNVPGATYDVDHHWRVTKSVDRTHADVPQGTSAPFEYTVRLEALPADRSGHELGGTMTVTNPNVLAMRATLSSTITGGSACTISATDVAPAPGLQVDLAPGSNPFSYTCSPGTDPADGSTTATVAWDAATYPQSGAGATYTRSHEEVYAYAVDQRTDEQTTVTDTFHGGAAEDLGTFTWGDVWGANAQHTVVVRTYTRDIAGVPGACTSYANTAAESADGTQAGRSVTVCVGRDLVVTTDADLGYQRELLWDVAKSGPGTVWTGRDADGQLRRSVRFTIDVTADGMTDSAWALTGTILVDNPNDWAVPVDVTDTVVVDGRTLSCDVAGGQDAVVPANAVDVPFAYECAGVEQGDYVGRNTATVDYGDAPHAYPHDSASTTVDVEVSGDPEPTNATVTISDLLDGTDVTGDLPQTTFDWEDVHAMDGHIQRITYDVVLGTTSDACTPHTNTVTIDQTGQDASHTVSVCSPGVAKTVVADHGRKQLWDVTKEVDRTRVEITEGGTATFAYTVTATPGDVVDDGSAAWSGTISVHNPSTTTPLTVDVADLPAVAGWTCELTVDGTGVAIEPGGTAEVHYTCTGSGHPSGTNTATVTFADQQSVSRTVDVVFEPRSEIRDSVVEVYDDKTDPSRPPVLLGTADAGDEDSWEFQYSLVKSGVAGACTTYTNTAVARLEASEDETDSAQAELCVQRPLTADVSGQGSYGVTYPWEIDKDVDRTRVEVDSATGEAVFDYTVTVRAGEAQPAGWTMGGTIRVANPNTYAGGAITLTGATVTTDLGGGAACAATLPDAPVVPAGSGGAAGTLDVPFACTFTGEPATSGQVHAEVTWDPAGPSATAAAADDGPASLSVGEETHRTVDVIDDKTDPANPVVLERGLTWSEDLVKEYAYSLTHQGVAGTCVARTNTATIDLDPDRGQQPTIAGAGDPTASTTATVCVEAPLTATATAEADLARAYAWSVDKVVDATERTVDAAGNATFRYTVTARAGAATDSGWQLSGTVTAANPNTYDEGAITLTGLAVSTDLGGGSACSAVLPGSPVVPTGTAGTAGTLTVPFSCTFTSAPAGSGTVTAAVSWDPPGEDASESATAARAVGFAVRSETDEVVDVVDDQTVPGQRTVLAEDVVWEAGLVRSYSYDLVLRGGAAGACQTYTNTARIDLPAGTDPSDSATVRACTPPPAPAPPAPPEVLPEQAGKAVGAVTSTCQGTVRARLGNRTDERVVYTLKVGTRTHRIAVRSGASRKFVTSGRARARVVLTVQGRVLDRLRVQDRCAPPEVLPETGFRAAPAARHAALTRRWR